MSKRIEKAKQLLSHGAYEDAAKICRSAIKLGQDVLPAKKTLARCLYNQSVHALQYKSGYREAEKLLREAIEFDPVSTDALNNLGALLLIDKRPAEAVEILTRCERLSPKDIRTLENLALAQEEAERYEAASESMCKLAVLNPAHATAYLAREALMMPAIPSSEDFVRNSRTNALKKLLNLEASGATCSTSPLHFPSTYFRYAYHGDSNLKINAALGRVYAKAFPSLLWEAPNLVKHSRQEGKIRLGIASAFLQTHSIGSVSRGFFEKLDRDKFEVIAIRLQQSNHDDVAQEIDSHADEVLEIIAPDLELARQKIAALELDVLFYQDIGMEPFSYFLAFSRLAPVQMTWFGHPDTTGITNIDYYISAKPYEMENGQNYYTEHLVVLGEAKVMGYYHHPVLQKESLSKADFGLNEDQTIYCCPQQVFKIQPSMDRLFSKILNLDPRAVIILFEPAEKHWKTSLQGRFKAFSDEVNNRVKFLPSQSYQRYLHLLQLSDVVLDSTPFNGYNTTLECFAVGTPVVTLAGTMQRERFGVGLYEAMGFMDLVTHSASDYAQLAVKVASDRVYRKYCCDQIERGNGKLFENIDFIRAFETAISNSVLKQ